MLGLMSVPSIHVCHMVCLRSQLCAVNDVWFVLSTLFCIQNYTVRSYGVTIMCAPLATTLMSTTSHCSTEDITMVRHPSNTAHMLWSQRQQRALKVYVFDKHSVNDMAVHGVDLTQGRATLDDALLLLTRTMEVLKFLLSALWNHSHSCIMCAKS